MRKYSAIACLGIGLCLSLSAVPLAYGDSCRELRKLEKKYALWRDIYTGMAAASVACAVACIAFEMCPDPFWTFVTVSGVVGIGAIAGSVDATTTASIVTAGAIAALAIAGYRLTCSGGAIASGLMAMDMDRHRLKHKATRHKQDCTPLPPQTADSALQCTPEDEHIKAQLKTLGETKCEGCDCQLALANPIGEDGLPIDPNLRKQLDPKSVAGLSAISDTLNKGGNWQNQMVSGLGLGKDYSLSPNFTPSDLSNTGLTPRQAQAINELATMAQADTPEGEAARKALSQVSKPRSSGMEGFITADTQRTGLAAASGKGTSQVDPAGNRMYWDAVAKGKESGINPDSKQNLFFSVKAGTEDWAKTR